MASVAAVARPRGLAVTLSPVTFLFGGFALWWALGLGGFIWILLAVPMAVSLLGRRRLKIPRTFGIWVLFLLWIAASAIRLDSATRGIVFTYRLGLYLGAGVVLLYIYNSSRERLPSSSVINSIGWLWIVIVIGGTLGLVVPEFTTHSLTEGFMPGAFLGNDWVHDMVHLEFAEGLALRPNAPFTYTNEWGANFALAAPLAWCALRRWKRRPVLWWPILLAMAAASLLLSTNRGAWVSLGLAMLYGTMRLAVHGDARPLARLLPLGGLIVVLLVATPLGVTLQDALSQRESTETRFSIYDQTRDAVLESPLFGYGAPRPARDPSQPPLGTHGQLWMVSFSHGIPAVILYVLFLLGIFWRTRRGATQVEFFAHMTLFIALIQLPFYGALPAQIFIVMTAAGLALRERLPQAPAEDPADSAGPRADGRAELEARAGAGRRTALRPA